MRTRRSRGLPILLLGALLPAAGPAARADWGGDGCAPETELRQIVDAALASAPAAAALGDGSGSGAAGYSVAVLHDGCGLLAYAVGQRNVERGLVMLPSTRQHVGSLTKPVTAALTLILAEQGLFGPDGIDAVVGDLLTRDVIRRLTRGADRNSRLCPARIAGIDRETLEPAAARGKCPNLSRITVRHLLNGNHGMWDFINEVDRDRNGFGDFVDFQLRALFAHLGIPHAPLPADLTDAREVIEAVGLLRHPQARIGGNRITDFELSFGNTGYQLLGILIEELTGSDYDALVRLHVTSPLGLGRMELLTEAPRRDARIARAYAVTTGAERLELPGSSRPLATDLFGLYPLADVHGHSAINAFSLEPFLITNGGGGAGALVASPQDYVRFFHALVAGGLLAPAAQALLDDGFLEVEGLEGTRHGFGLFELPASPIGRLLFKDGATIASRCFALHSPLAGGGNSATVVVCRSSADLFLPNDGIPATAVPVDDVALDLLVTAMD